MRSQRVFQKVLITDAFASPPRLPYKNLERGRYGSEGYIATYSEDDSKNALPAASFATSGDFIMLVTAAVHGTGLMGVYQTEIDYLGAQAD